MKGRKFILVGAVILLVLLGVWIGDHYLHFLPRDTYSGEHFDIVRYRSKTDKDKDGLDDQSDIYQATRAYLAKSPKYKSKYYEGGYPDDGQGVCTDVVAFALRDAGYDLQSLLAADIAASPEAYAIEKPDPNIDFRRVRNLSVYLQRHAIALTTDLSAIEVWQPGDIVVFKKHIGMISDKRDKQGVPFLLHHAHPYQVTYEEPLAAYQENIVGHYRIS